MEALPLALQNPSPDYVIRPVQMADVEMLHHVCWPDRTQDSVHHMVLRAQQIARQGRGLGIVIADSESAHLDGYGQLTLWPHCGEISDLVVRESKRRRGLGTALIQYLVRAAGDMQVVCVEIGGALSNPGAVGLYRRLGFSDSHTVMLNLGEGTEPVMFLRLMLQSGSPPRHKPDGKLAKR